MADDYVEIKLDAHHRRVVRMAEDLMILKKPRNDHLIVELRNIRTDASLSGNDFVATIIGMAIEDLGGEI